ncbi:MAG: DUF2169 domain-containing protein [SAR116 cluster bacterium]|nr:MAG: DUF2169 domain-containing protein [SAR116 cluster bacterium]|tara:strand:+ start:3446 stop:6454 length:3009 start_codon:yes stop_codon:yes gene_type:complete
MRIIKPFTLPISYRAFSLRGQHCLAVTVFQFFDVDDPNQLILEQEMWGFLGERLPGVPDLGMPKAKAELVLLGEVQAPAGQMVEKLEARAQIDKIHAELNVLGDHYWQTGPDGRLTMTRPQFFATMPLGWEHSYGGPGYEHNPLGCGHKPEASIRAGKPAKLPNIQLLGDEITAANQLPRHAFSGHPYPAELLIRQRMAGTYDKNWLKKKAPFLPEDIDWLYFNRMPPMMQQEGFFAPSTPFRLVHFHADASSIEAVLPPFVTRIFSAKGEENKPGQITETKSVIDTVMLDGSAKRGIAIHRGIIKVEDSDAADIGNLLVAFERVGDEPRPQEHYVQFISKRADPEHGWMYVLQDFDLSPLRSANAVSAQADALAEADLVEQKRKTAGENLIMEQVKMSVGEELSFLLDETPAEGISEDAPAIKDPPKITPYDIENFHVDLKAMNDWARETEAALEAKKKELIDKYGDGVPTPEPILSEQRRVEKIVGEPLTLNAEKSDLENKKFVLAKALGQLHGSYLDELSNEGNVEYVFGKLESVLAESIEVYHENKDKFSRAKDGTHNANDEIAENSGDNIFDILDDINPSSVPEDVPNQKEELKKVLPDAYGKLIDKVQDNEKSSVSKTPEDALEEISKVRSLVGEMEDITLEAKSALHDSLLLSDQAFLIDPLPNENVRAYLGDVVATHHNLGWSFQGRDLTGANLKGADLRHADFRDCNLQLADLSGADLRHAKLTRCVLIEANLQGALLDGADLTEANLSKAQLDDAHGKGCQLISCHAMGLVARRAKFPQANLQGGVWMECDLEGMDLQAAVIKDFDLFKTSIKGMRLNDAHISGLSIFEGEASCLDLTNAYITKFSPTKVTLTNWIANNAIFENFAPSGFDFSGLIAKGAKFTGKGNSFHECILIGADFRGAMMDGVDLSKSNASQANFAGASLRGAFLNNANLSECNFVGADLLRANFRKSALARADLGRVNLYQANLDQAVYLHTNIEGANIKRTLLEAD